jgi:hypothetical protein
MRHRYVFYIDLSLRDPEHGRTTRGLNETASETEGPEARPVTIRLFFMDDNWIVNDPRVEPFCYEGRCTVSSRREVRRAFLVAWYCFHLDNASSSSDVPVSSSCL